MKIGLVLRRTSRNTRRSWETAHKLNHYEIIKTDIQQQLKGLVELINVVVKNASKMFYTSSSTREALQVLLDNKRHRLELRLRDRAERPKVGVEVLLDVIGNVYGLSLRGYSTICQ